MAPEKFAKDIQKRIVDGFNQRIYQKELSIKYNVHNHQFLEFYHVLKKLSVEAITKGVKKTDKRTDAFIVREIRKFPFKSTLTLVKEFNISVRAKTVS